MLNFMWCRFRNPIALLKRVFYKFFIGPRKYGTEDGYDAEAYWGDRFRKYGDSLCGPGDEGLSEAENVAAYEAAGRQFRDLLVAECPDLAGLRVLEIGTGTGFYTGILHDMGVTNYTGLDITDAMFDTLRERHPNSAFERKDITTDCVEGPYDLVVMIDVMQHIVEDDRFQSALANVRDALAPGGKFVLTPKMNTSRKCLFYVHSWNHDDVARGLEGCELGEPVQFRTGDIMFVRKPTDQPTTDS